MVKLEEVSADHIDSDDVPSDSDSDEYSDEYSDDENEREDESVLDRLYALRDIIPLKQREALANNARRVYGWGRIAITFAGKSAWVLTTTMMLLVLPLALEIEKEQALITYEKEAQAQQQGAQQMLTGPGQQQKEQKGLISPGF